MSGIDFVADTNFLIDLHEGKPIVEPFLDQSAAVSVISEIELLGWPGIAEAEKRKLRALLSDCVLVDLSPEIRKMTIQLRQQKRLKVADAIIAATAQYLQVPVVTSDKGFKNIEGIKLILIS